MIQRAFGKPDISPANETLPQEPLELDACYRYCESVARSRHHNFPVASFFIPQHLRKYICAIYAFARAADDFADEAPYEGRRLIELDAWEEQLTQSFYGEKPKHPIFFALQDTTKRFNLPITFFQSLLTGFRSDLEEQRFSTHHDLREYTKTSAEPVGHLYLYLFGYTDPALLRYVSDMASGLAYANFWQDLSSDLGRGRLYIPLEDLNHFGIDESALFSQKRLPELKHLLRYEVARTRALFERSRPLVDLIGDEISIEFAIAWHGGMRILEKIHDNAQHILDRRPHLNQLDKAKVVTKALAWKGSALGRRGKEFFSPSHF